MKDGLRPPSISGLRGRYLRDSKRCLVPASAFFELRARTIVTPHRSTLVGAPFMAIGSLWRESEENHPASCTMLTTEPDPGFCPILARQIVVLEPQSGGTGWSSQPEAGLLRPRPKAASESPVLNFCCPVIGRNPLVTVAK
ncbi:SOS response-associated peptidase family protein [Rhizobium mongolense]